MLVDSRMPLLINRPCRLEGDWDVEPEQAWSAASESSLNPMSRLEDVSRSASRVCAFVSPLTSYFMSQFLVGINSENPNTSIYTDLILIRAAMERLEYRSMSGIT